VRVAHTRCESSPGGRAVLLAPGSFPSSPCTGTR
jgi:hypothetical protein